MTPTPPLGEDSVTAGVGGRQCGSKPNCASTEFKQAPANPLNRYVKLGSDHSGTLTAGKDAVLSWLSDLAAAQH